ncbi:PA14 domain-containing protein [Cesiribacter sp. SM1]|uniref:PKD domain-containing protein n=2 Tax=Cesiribacter sp. SM1 TaxID=2861196 RepID=UPI001CD293E9|nr:PA14 domain-containing protein [Cesiribacter sp. SM1]
MKKLAQFTTKLICILAALGWSMSAYGQGDNKARPLGSTSSPYGYYEYLPVDYNSNSNNYPVLIYLHGLGEKGNGTTQLGDAIKHGPQREVTNGRDFPFIIVSPQTDVWWSVDKLNSYIEWLKKKYRVNADKIYLTGNSMGGISTFDYVNKYPNQLAAIVPICGENKRLSNSCNITGVKLWAFHGDADPTINVRKSIDAVNAYNACNPNPLGKLTIYPGVNHNSWTRTYDGSAGHDIYKWMLQYSRGSSRTSNQAPTVSAGSDKTITLPTNSITLSGTASDADGSIASTTWTKVSGPSASMSGASTLSLKLSSLLEGTYTFRLTAKDNAGATKTDDVVLTVKPQPVTSDPVSSANGLNYKYYTTTSGSPWKVMPNFSNLKPVKTGTLSNFSISPKTQSNYLAFLYEGQIQIDAAGTYTFYTYSDDGSQLFINGNLVANNDGTHAAQERSGSVYLAAGKHNIKVAYFEYVNGETLAVKYSGPGISKQSIPDSKLFKGSSTTNAAPTVSAGSDKSVTLPTNSITLSGTASDADGSIASTTWTKVSGPSASMSGASTLSLKLSSLLEGTYTFRLTAKDNAGATKTDDVVLTVKSQTSSTTTNGLSYKYYTTTSGSPWKVLPNFSSLTPAKTGTISNFSLSPKTQSNYFAFLYEGQIQIDAAGTYTFYTYSDDGSQLFINGNLVANNDGAHAAQERSGSVYLAAGKHNIKVTYFEHISSEVLTVKYAGPGISKQTIPNTKLYSGNSSSSGSSSNTGEEDSYTGTAPSSLSATVNPYFTGAGLSWKDNSNNEKGYEIFMSVGNNSSYKQVGSTGSNKTSYGVGISKGNVYYFKIRAKIGTGHSAFSNEVRLSTVSGSSSAIAGADSVGTEEFSSLSEITEVTAYPNPASDHINISIGSEFNGNVSLQLINMAGQLQFSESVHTAEAATVRLDLDQYQLQTGIYILKVSDGYNQKSLKILKK